MQSLVAGDVGCIPSGSYTEANMVVRQPGPITLQPSPGASVTLCGHLEFVGAPSGGNARDWTIRGFKIDLHCSGQAGGIQVYDSGDKFIGNDISSPTPNCCHSGGTNCFMLGSRAYGLADGTVIDHNRIHNCGDWDGVGPHAIYGDYNVNSKITNNYIYKSPGFNMQFYKDTDKALFANNVVDGAEHLSGILIGGELEDGSCLHSDNNTIRDNIFTDNAQYGVSHWWPSGCAPTGMNFVSHNCFFGNGRGDDDTAQGITSTSDNLHADPLYVNRAAENFQLRPGSPCAGMGPQGTVPGL